MRPAEAVASGRPFAPSKASASAYLSINSRKRSFAFVAGDEALRVLIDEPRRLDAAG